MRQIRARTPCGKTARAAAHATRQIGVSRWYVIRCVNMQSPNACSRRRALRRRGRPTSPGRGAGCRASILSRAACRPSPSLATRHGWPRRWRPQRGVRRGRRSTGSREPVPPPWPVPDLGARVRSASPAPPLTWRQRRTPPSVQHRRAREPSAPPTMSPSNSTVSTCGAISGSVNRSRHSSMSVGTELAHVATSGRVRNAYSDSASSTRHGLISIRAVRSGQSRSARVLGTRPAGSCADGPTPGSVRVDGSEVADTEHSGSCEPPSRWAFG